MNELENLMHYLSQFNPGQSGAGLDLSSLLGLPSGETLMLPGSNATYDNMRYNANTGVNYSPTNFLTPQGGGYTALENTPGMTQVYNAQNKTWTNVPSGNVQNIINGLSAGSYGLNPDGSYITGQPVASNPAPTPPPAPPAFIDPQGNGYSGYHPGLFGGYGANLAMASL